MKYIYLTSFAILMCKAAAFSQISLSNKKTFNVTLSTIVEEPIESNFKSRKTRVRPGVGMTFISSNLFSHEFSIREIWFQQQSWQTSNSNGNILAGEEQSNFNTSFRYGFGKYLKTINERIFFNLSIGIVGQYQLQVIQPRVGYAFNTSRSIYSLYAELTPSISFITKGNKIINFAIPVNIHELNKSTQKIENPAIPENLRKNSTDHTQWFPSLFEIKISYGFLK